MKCTSRIVGRSAAVALVTLVCLAAAASATALLPPGATYRGRSASCAPGTSGKSPVPGTVCFFVYRANKAGTTLTPASATVLSSWRCHAGGGIAELGGRAKYADPLPIINVSANRALHGSAGHGQKRVTVTGNLSANGMTLTLVFHLINGNEGCVSAQEKLTRH